MSDNDEFIGEQIEDSATLQAKYSLALNKLNQVITSIFGIVNKYGSSFSFSENKHFLDKRDLDSNVFLLKEICQEIDNIQDHLDDSPVELNILPIISQTNIGRFQNFSSQLGDSNPGWYIGFNETKALLNFASIWHKKDVEIAGANNPHDQHKDLLIAYAKWQCLAPIGGYLSQAMNHKVVACYSGKSCELNIQQDQYTNNLINNGISNCIYVFSVTSSLDGAIAQTMLDATEYYVPLDYSIAAIDHAFALQNFTTITDAITKDCNLTLSNKEYQTLNLANIDCLLNWEIY